MISLKDKEYILKRIREKNYAYRLEFGNEAVRNDKDIVLASVQQDGNDLKYASEALKADEDVALEAIQQDGRAIKYVNKKLLSNKLFVLKALMTSKSYIALTYIDEVLRDDEDVVLAAVKQAKDVGGIIVCFEASGRLKKDKEFMTKVISINAAELCHASNELKDDKEFVLLAVKKDGRALMYASNRLKDDEDVVLEAAKQNEVALYEASGRLQKDIEFLSLVKKEISKERVVNEKVFNLLEEERTKRI